MSSFFLSLAITDISEINKYCHQQSLKSVSTLGTIRVLAISDLFVRRSLTLSSLSLSSAAADILIGDPILPSVISDRVIQQSLFTDLVIADLVACGSWFLTALSLSSASIHRSFGTH
jgi:hypothetical protein